jgi:uroporphyrinogen-III synthase
VCKSRTICTPYELNRAGIDKASLTRARLAAIGSVTAQTLAEMWRPCDIQPSDATADALAAAIIEVGKK